MKISIIGCGTLGIALARGFLSQGLVKPADLILSKRDPSVLSSFREKGVQITSDNAEAARNSNFIILAVKPYNVEKILLEIKSELKSDVHSIISVATGIKTTQITEWTGLELPVFRAMPNTAAGIGESVTAISSIRASADLQEEVSKLFSSIGIVIPIEEELMEAATILGACGIAYVMRFIRAMIQGGIQIGFDAKTASLIVNQAVRGASGLLLKDNTHPESEIDKVTTPKGCTIVGLNEMEHNGFSSALIKGIVSSYQKIEK